MIKKCKICGTEFNATGKHVYCSDECRKKGRKAYQQEYHRSHRDHLREYRENYRKSKSKTLKVCLVCGTKFFSHGNRKYCSEECSQKARRMNHRKNLLQWRKQHPEYDRNYYQAHKEHICENRRKHYRKQKMSFLERFFEETDLTPTCGLESCCDCPYEDCIDADNEENEI